MKLNNVTTIKRSVGIPRPRPSHHWCQDFCGFGLPKASTVLGETADLKYIAIATASSLKTRLSINREDRAPLNPKN